MKTIFYNGEITPRTNLENFVSDGIQRIVDVNADIYIYKNSWIKTSAPTTFEFHDIYTNDLYRVYIFSNKCQNYCEIVYSDDCSSSSSYSSESEDSCSTTIECSSNYCYCCLGGVGRTGCTGCTGYTGPTGDCHHHCHQGCIGYIGCTGPYAPYPCFVINCECQKRCHRGYSGKRDKYDYLDD